MFTIVTSIQSHNDASSAFAQPLGFREALYLAESTLLQITFTDSVLPVGTGKQKQLILSDTKDTVIPS